MPRLVTYAVPIVLGIRKVKSEAARVGFQPTKFPRSPKPGFEVEVRGRSQIQCASGVVFAATRCGDQAQDGVDRFARGEFGADNFGLARNAPKTGEREQGDAIVSCGGAHAFPCVGRAWNDTNDFSVVGRRSD